MKETQKPEWNEVKRKIRNKFTKLNDTDLEGLEGHMDRLQIKVQTVYGYSSEKAKEECKQFNLPNPNEPKK